MPYPAPRVPAAAAAATCWHRHTLDVTSPGAAAGNDFAAFLTGRLHRARRDVAAELAAELGGVTVLTAPDTDPADADRWLQHATVDALTDPSVHVIVGGRLGDVADAELRRRTGNSGPALDPDRVSHPDLLFITGRRPDGTPVQVRPGIVAAHAETEGTARGVLRVSTLRAPLRRRPVTGSVGRGRSKDLITLAGIHRQLTNLGLTGGAPYGAVTGTGHRLVWFRLDTATVDDPTFPGVRVDAVTGYTRGFHRYRQVVEAAAEVRDYVDGAQVLTSPCYDAATCPMCPYWESTCAPRLRADWPGGHITLLPGITPRRAGVHLRAGVESVQALARLDPATAQALADGAALDTLADADEVTLRYADDRPRQLPEAIWQARVALSGAVHRRPGGPALHMPRADVEVDIDLENTVDGLVYLWGVHIGGRDDAGEDVTFATFTGDSDGEAATFAAFWAHLAASRAAAAAAQSTWRCYHYSPHERSAMLRLAAAHAGAAGVPTVQAVTDLFASGDMVDLLTVARTLMWPTMSVSLKDTAALTGFRWRHDGANGAAALAWYEEAVGGGADAPAMRSRLLEYVLDDVHAQRALRQALTAWSADGAQPPPATALPAPAR